MSPSLIELATPLMEMDFCVVFCDYTMLCYYYAKLQSPNHRIGTLQKVDFLVLSMNLV